ncbi:MAG TPA: DUF3347 domain-containing protein, partial [Mariniphaga sp.]|nr:DUF3347 domain-containing protein [Mariniphaga sp.]
NALVNDDPEAAAGASRKATEALNHVDMALLEGAANDHWMMLLMPMKKALKNIESTTDIEKQRAQFNTLSNNIIDMTESFGLEADIVYKQYCPMAFDDAGAHWLSESDEVLNPYFGDMMLHCGEVQETYKRGQRIFNTEEMNETPATQSHNH